MQEKGKTANKGKIRSWFQGVRSEFGKIIWTDRNTLIKQTIVVVITTIILGVLISIMDAGILECINLLMK